MRYAVCGIRNLLRFPIAKPTLALYSRNEVSSPAVIVPSMTCWEPRPRTITTVAFAARLRPPSKTACCSHTPVPARNAEASFCAYFSSSMRSQPRARVPRNDPRAHSEAALASANRF
eukprot:scaffold63_cov306-Pinguiococcus_pyrenoidosus.AAC.25